MIPFQRRREEKKEILKSVKRFSSYKVAKFKEFESISAPLIKRRRPLLW